MESAGRLACRRIAVADSPETGRTRRYPDLWVSRRSFADAGDHSTEGYLRIGSASHSRCQLAGVRKDLHSGKCAVEVGSADRLWHRSKQGPVQTFSRSFASTLAISAG